MRVSVHEERLEASKRLADAGDGTISKQVVTEQQTIDVPETEFASCCRLPCQSARSIAKMWGWLGFCHPHCA